MQNALTSTTFVARIVKYSDKDSYAEKQTIWTAKKVKFAMEFL
jgi:hypothetical protein